MFTVFFFCLVCMFEFSNNKKLREKFDFIRLSCQLNLQSILNLY